MIYHIPPDRSFRSGLATLDQLRDELGERTALPTPWVGALRRSARASAVESSVSIEGYWVPPGEGLALVSDPSGASPLDDEGRMAIACYAHAMDHVGIMALDPVFEWTERVILDLHFDACSFQRERSPGLWRTEPIAVTGEGDRIAYRGPDANDVVGLMSEVVEWLRAGDLDAHVIVRAAMAHLHVVSVHPFRDGNGRIARIVQSLVLARGSLLAPELASIEDYLASHTGAYYATLGRVQGGTYSPARDASEWVSFCIDAHIVQARRRLEQVAEAARRWQRLERLVADRSWPDRLVIALEQSLVGGTDRAKYEQEGGISPATASNDFRRLLDARLVIQRGRARSTRYVASEELRRLIDSSDA